MIQAAVLDQTNLDIIRHKRVGSRRDALGQDMCRRIDNRTVFGVVVGRQGAIRAVAAHRNGFAAALGLLALQAGDAENFDRDGVSENFALEFANPLCGAGESE